MLDFLEILGTHFNKLTNYTNHFHLWFAQLVRTILQLEGALTRLKMPAFNLSSPVAIPGAAFSGKSYSEIQIALECYSFDGNPTLTFKFLWSVNLLRWLFKGIYQLPCKFEIFWLFF